MDHLWKQLLQLDAKRLCFGSMALFLVVLGVVSWLSVRGKTTTAMPPPAPSASTIPISSNDIGVLRFVESQRAGQALIIPGNPFRPSIEDMNMNLATGTTNVPPPPVNDTTNPPTGKPGQPNKIPGRSGTTSATAGKPTFTFRGYFQRPDGTSAALFHYAADNTYRFFLPGSNLQSTILLSANIHTAQVQHADGQVVNLGRGDAFTLQKPTP